MGDRVLEGTVREFDESSGLGLIAGDDGSEVPFHCLVITDGTRRIEVGSKVVFSLFPAPGGRCEARFVRKS